MSFFSSLETAFSSWFSKTETEVTTFLKPLAASLIANGGTLLLTAATGAVVAAETAGGTGVQKLAAAVASVKSTLTTGGLALADSTINGAIEAAVAALPKQVAQVATAVAAAPAS